MKMSISPLIETNSKVLIAVSSMEQSPMFTAAKMRCDDDFTPT